MNNKWFGMVCIVGAFCLPMAGCSGDGDESSGHYHPAVEVTGTWDVRMDGDPLGVMKLEVSEGGTLKGTLTTTQDATAQLAGAMDEYLAEFTVTFPTEAYLATLTFNSDASGASGILLDHEGFKRVLRMTPRFGE